MRWRQATSTLYAADRITLGPHLRVQAGLRLESVRATNGSATVAWTSVFPRVGVDVPITPSVHVFADLSRAGLPLPPAALAFGDPRAPTGRVYAWHDLDANGRASTGEFGPLVARVGPGAGPAGLSSIDPHLIRPTQAQGLLGLAVERSRWTFSLTAIVRRQADVIQPVDTGAAYTARVVADAGLSYPDPPTDTLTVFDRTASSFGADAYVLTNPPGLTDRFEGLDASLQLRLSRISLAFGATAARTRASTVGRGFRVAENDPGVLDVSANPNALVNAIGRPFADRGYTGKVALAIRLPAETRLGLLVRYQDGQPFSRLSVISDLAQGAEPVRSYAPGRTRFTFVGTIDARLQKRLRAGRGRVDSVLDVFNLLDARREVEEIVASTPSFRVTSAVAPPRSARLALRVGF